MYCPDCGRANPSGAGFCTFCGSLLSNNPRSRTAAPQAEVKKAQARPASSARAPRKGTYQPDSWDLNSIIERWWNLFSSSNNRSETDDLAHGQVVVIAARWILVVAGLMLALWNPESLGELQVSILLILGLAVANFFLHAQVLMGKQTLAAVAYSASAADIAVISLVLIVDGGFGTIPFVFYFPALLAISVAYPTRVTAAFTAAAIGIYGVVSMATAPEEAAIIITHAIMLASITVCGHVYWRIERDRRTSAAEGKEVSKAPVRDKVPAR